MYRGLDRFKKAQSLEPFSVTVNSSSKVTAPTTVPSFQPQNTQAQPQQQNRGGLKPPAPELAATAAPVQQATQVGGGQSTWQPPDWAIEPRPGFYYLEVLKDGEAIGQINLDKRRHIFGRQFPVCDFVLDHQSVSRQHAAVVPHKNGSVYVIDLGSAHGTFVANERLTKDNPVELEVGQSLRFAASTRTYILRKNAAALFPPPPVPDEINLPSPPDPSDEEAVLAYNTILNRFGLTKSDLLTKSTKDSGAQSTQINGSWLSERSAKRLKRMRVAFKDQVGGQLVEVVGISDGADVDTEPGPVGVKEGSLVGKYESLVQTTVIPKGKEAQMPQKEESVSPKGVTDKLQQVFDKVKAAPKGKIYDDLYGDSVPIKVGSSWAYTSAEPGNSQAANSTGNAGAKPDTELGYDNDDLFG